MPDVVKLLQELLLVFTSVLFIVDPFAVVPSTLTMTARDSPDMRRALPRRGAWTAAITLAAFALAGGLIFKLFGITIAAFKIAGPDRYAHPHPLDGAGAMRHSGAVHSGRHPALWARPLMNAGVRLLALVPLLGATPAAAQEPGLWVRWGAQAVPALTAASVVPGDRTLVEWRVVQPVAMLHAGALGDRVLGDAMVNLERFTILHGELAPGDWSEGFVDRRHPHTLVHELMLTAPDLLRGSDGRAELFVALGKGFVPFGTDDPMVRPPVRFPVNHHLSQILERAVGIVGVRAGFATLEGALFNGDEPVSPTSWPALDRFGDSWAARLTVTPFAGLETQLSHAFVHSPENRPGAGPDDSKWSASVRWEHGGLSALAEWARTATAGGVFVFHTRLAEAALQRGRHRPYWRLERTERPEEERVFGSPFRTRRPLFENSILGITRWTILTAGYGFDLTPSGPIRVTPVVEGSYVGIAKVGGGVFDPAIFFGRDRGYSLTVGARLGSGMTMHRMGRYGIRPSPHDMMVHGDHWR